jgi:hypothetical protein
MSPRTSLLALAAVAVAAVSTLMPGDASAFSRGNPTAGPTHVITSTPALVARSSYGWGYGRGWCYWHPYACYRNR